MPLPKYIRRNMVLKEMDIRWLPNGRRSMFSIKFVDKKGCLHFIPRAYACGLPYNVREARQRGVTPCNEFGEAIDHVYPVGIDNILMYNTMEVIL